MKNSLQWQNMYNVSTPNVQHLAKRGASTDCWSFTVVLTELDSIISDFFRMILIVRRGRVWLALTKLLGRYFSSLTNIEFFGYGILLATINCTLSLYWIWRIIRRFDQRVFPAGVFPWHPLNYCVSFGFSFVNLFVISTFIVNFSAIA